MDNFDPGTVWVIIVFFQHNVSCIQSVHNYTDIHTPHTQPNTHTRPFTLHTYSHTLIPTHTHTHSSHACTHTHTHTTHTHHTHTHSHTLHMYSLTQAAANFQWETMENLHPHSCAPVATPTKGTQLHTVYCHSQRLLRLGEEGEERGDRGEGGEEREGGGEREERERREDGGEEKEGDYNSVFITIIVSLFPPLPPLPFPPALPLPLPPFLHLPLPHFFLPPPSPPALPVTPTFSSWKWAQPVPLPASYGSKSMLLTTPRQIGKPIPLAKTLRKW